MLRWLTIVGTVGMIAVNALANALPINGKTTGDISNGFEILFTPAGYVFSIWGLIYLALVVFTVVQALPSRQDNAVLERVRPWYLVNTAANGTWIFAWHHERFVVSLTIMLVILGSLVVIYRRVGTITLDDGVAFATVRSPFSLYFGWISIATIANVTVVLWTLGATDLLREPVVTLVLVGAATALCATVALRFADPVYAAVFVWALVGIAADNDALPLLYGGSLASAGICAVVAAIAARRAMGHAAAAAA